MKNDQKNVTALTKRNDHYFSAFENLPCEYFQATKKFLRNYLKDKFNELLDNEININFSRGNAALADEQESASLSNQAGKQRLRSFKKQLAPAMGDGLSGKERRWRKLATLGAIFPILMTATKVIRKAYAQLYYYQLNVGRDQCNARATRLQIYGISFTLIA